MDAAQEISLIAQEYMALGTFKCRWAIQQHLARAGASGDWNELRKWYRVQLRVRRLSKGLTCDTPAERQFARGPVHDNIESASAQSVAI